MSLPTLFEYLPKDAAIAILKLAEEKKPHENAPKHVAKTIGSGLLGLAGGTLAGYGAGALANKGYELIQGHPVPGSLLAPTASVLGGAGGLAYALWKAKEQEELKRAFEGGQNRPEGLVPGE